MFKLQFTNFYAFPYKILHASQQCHKAETMYFAWLQYCCFIFYRNIT